MEKAEIVAEIRRMAAANDGQPPGQKRFFAETDVRQHEVLGVHWSTWSDALVDAGFTPNEWNGPADEEALVAAYVNLARKLGRLPTRRELGIERRRNPDFPGVSTFFRRLGSKAQLAERVRFWCSDNPGNDDVLAMCPEPMPGPAVAPEPDANNGTSGFVYLMRSGRYYKIGYSNSTGRREYEVALQLPERIEIVHEIKTDDPSGVESYWHRRFADRRKGGECFDLLKADVSAFKRWRRIY